MFARPMLWLILPAVALTAGCASVGDSRRQAAMREETEKSRLTTDVERLKEATEGLHASRQDVYRDIEAVRTEINEIERRLNEEVASLRLQLKALESARQQDKRELIDSFSERISALMRSAPAPSHRGESGYEHVVQPGQTLSEIAAAYNTRIEIIVRANNLSNANAIRAGQKLFIPE